MQKWKSIISINFSDWAQARNYESMLEIYMSHLHIPTEEFIEVVKKAFINFKMADSLDKAVVLASKCGS